MKSRTNLKFLALLAASAAVIGGLSGCSASHASSRSNQSEMLKIPREDFSTFTRNFNPFSPNAVPMTNVAVYEPLFVVNPVKGNQVPWLATSWKTDPGGAGVTMHLRNGVKWSDGKPFTSADVAYTFQLIKKLSGADPYISRITTPNKLTVKFSFSKAYSPGLYEIGQQIIVPKHVWSKVKNPSKYVNANPVGTGPYTKVADFEPQSYELTKNPHYWQPEKQQIKGVEMVAESGNTGASLALQNGQVDWGDQYVPNIKKVFVAKDSVHNHYWYPPVGGLVQWVLNTTKAPFNDVTVRKALSMGVNREQVVKLGESGYAKPADCTGLSDRYNSWRDPSVSDNCTWTKLNVEKANQLLDSAGYKKGSDGIRRLKDGKPFAFSISVGSTSSDWLSVAQVIAKNMKNLGVKVTVDSRDWSKISDAYSQGTFQTGIVWTNAGATPYEFYRGEMSQESVKPVGTDAVEDYGRFGDGTATKLLAQFASASSATSQKQIMDQLESRFDETAPAVPLFPSPAWGAYSSLHFTGWPTPNDPYADLSTRGPETVLVLTSLKPRK